MTVRAQHRKDVAKVAPKLAAAIHGVLAAQKRSGKRKLTVTGETAKTKAAVLPHITTAVDLGAARVATATGGTTPPSNANLAGAWSYKFASQFTSTTQGQLDDLTDTADTDDVARVFDSRAGLALAMATTIISNAVNAGAQDFAATLPQTAQPTKTWEVTDDHPCPECSSVDGETVPASQDFSNGTPHGPIHPGCGCTVTWTAAPSTRSMQRTDRMAKGEPVGLTASIKSQFVKDLADTSKTSETDLTGAFRRLCQWAASGHLPTGLSYSDVKELGAAVVKELKKRNPDSTASMGNFPALGSSKNALDDFVEMRCQALTDCLKACASDSTGNDTRAATKPCPTCDGTGKIMDGHRKCPDCAGTGEVPEKKSAGPLFEYRRNKAQALKGHMERRSFGIDQMELREQAGSDTLKFRGYASLTTTPYEVGPFTETIKRGAFKRTLGSSPDVQLLINHGDGGSGMPIARTGVNMTLTEDDKGLLVDADLDSEDTDVQNLARKMKNKLIDQMSLAFRADDQTWSDDFTQRTIKSVTIHRGDVSIVNQGASSLTSASIRSVEVLEGMRRFGYEAARDAWVDWARLITSTEPEERDASKLDAHTVEVLSAVLRAFQTIDDNADEGIPLLADLIGVPNPNKESSHTPDGTPKTTKKDAPHTSTTTDGTSRALRYRQEHEAAVLRGGGAPTLRARTPVAVINDPTGKQACPICTGHGKVQGDSDSKRNCSNCAGKGWVRKAAT